MDSIIYVTQCDVRTWSVRRRRLSLAIDSVYALEIVLTYLHCLPVMTVFFIIPIATIAAIIFFFLLGIMLWIRQRRRDGPVYVPRQNFLPMQPTIVNSYRPSPMSVNQPAPLQHYPYGVNPVPIPAPQLFSPAGSAPIAVPNPVNPMPYSPAPITFPNPVNPMPFSPAPITFPNPTTTPPNNPATSSELMDRMRQVQMLMVEIHRLESDPPSEGNQQRLQELRQRVAELSGTDTDKRMQYVPDPLAPPPYLSDVNQSVGKPEYYGAAGRG